MVLLKNDFSWNGAIRIGEIVSAFRCWQFSPSSFFSQKTPRKSWFFHVFFLPMWIPPKRKSKFHFGVKKNPTLIAVRIGVSCFYTFFTVFEHLVFYMYMFHWCVVPIGVSCFYTTFTFSKCRKSYIFCGSWKWFSALLVLCYVIGIY